MSPLLLDVLAGKLSPDQARAKDPTFDAQWDALRVASKRREDLPSPPDRTRRMEVEPTPRELTERARKELAKRRAPAPLPPEERKWSDLISRSIAKVEKELEETAKLPWTLDLCGMLVIPPVKSDDEEELDKRARLAWKPQAQILLEAAKGVGASYRELEKQIPEKDRPELERRIVDAIRNAERLGPWLTARCETLRKEWESRGRKALPAAPPPVAPSRSIPPPVPSPRTPPASSTRAAPAKPPRPPAAKPARRRAAPPLILPAGWPKHRPTTPCLCPTTKRRAVLVGPQSGWRCRTRRGIFAATPAACNRRRR